MRCAWLFIPVGPGLPGHKYAKRQPLSGQARTCLLHYALSPRERAGVRADNLTPNMQSSHRNQSSPHPNPLPRGEGTGAVFPVAHIFIALLLLAIAGCKPAQPIVPDNLLPRPIANEAPMPGYSELVERYNATLLPIDRIWAEARVDLEWINEKGDRKREHGDGRFMFAAPMRVALDIREVGKGFWAGGNETSYWLFDLQDRRVAYVGRYDNARNLDPDMLPLPVNPANLLYTLGLRRIDPDVVPEAPAVERVAGHYLIEPPGLGIRMLLHPKTARPVRVDILNRAGESVVKCLLSEPVKLKVVGDRAALGSEIASVIEVYVLDQEARMTLKLRDATTEDLQIKNPHFSFDILKIALKADEVVDLDAQSTPAP